MLFRVNHSKYSLDTLIIVYNVGLLGGFKGILWCILESAKRIFKH